MISLIKKLFSRNEWISLKWVVTHRCIRNGKVLWEFTSKNTIMNPAKTEILKLIGNLWSTHFGYLATGSGNGANTSSMTTLQTENTSNGFDRKTATLSLQTTTFSNDTLQYMANFTATGNVTVNEVGIFSNATGWILLWRNVIPTKNFVTNDVYQLVYKVTIA